MHHLLIQYTAYMQLIVIHVSCIIPSGISSCMVFVVVSLVPLSSLTFSCDSPLFLLL